MATRGKYSKEFKLDAISLVEEQGYATTEVASSLGIRPELIRRWITERQADDGQAFRGNGKQTPEQEEIKRLKTKMKRLEMEKKWVTIQPILPWPTRLGLMHLHEIRFFALKK
ncbi:MAG: transposase, partial [Candidatus Thiodiazotropha sp. (ex Lucinoma aequizonata)]|nr:transposase [Candidatus Thiodiazotropha sp. (ex Lucinoma aequizonata)]MCU7887442.1 transposase [Candidatus Thiodiazotropha sp. (ex Lucinoma aequizonata)]MCU7894444.1 transposase [Candidatus Thiodiazotropha sp. (ex Lucinoma aequizonata)]MCU7897479.1 transposase [Candidatus Thiodiazotropha sp. (ex Lucinoma aequizonata)]MCU7902259.1 transposase [Candidatus Thiodiazotropha sp. (ex Lucinoma aequizonata)]